MNAEQPPTPDFMGYNTPTYFVWFVVLLVVGSMVLSYKKQQDYKRRAMKAAVEKKKKEETPKILKQMTLTEIAAFNGTKEDQPIYLVVQGKIYEVSSNFYGPGAAYSVFAGRDCTLALAKEDFEEKYLDGSIDFVYEDLSWGEKEALDNWQQFFETKYEHIGNVKQEG